jgi:hypothetical protein
LILEDQLIYLLAPFNLAFDARVRFPTRSFSATLVLFVTLPSIGDRLGVVLPYFLLRSCE